MVLQPQICFSDFPPSPALHAHIKNKIKKLESFCPNAMRCHVHVRQSQKHKHQGKLFEVGIELNVPGKRLSVHRNNENVYIAIRDAFKAIRLSVQRFRQRQRGNVKHHPIPLRGQIARIYPEEGFGFIESNGNEYYFAEENLHDSDFDHIRQGKLVSFIADLNDEGWHALRVSTGKHGRLRY